MPLKPKTRSIGQIVEFADNCTLGSRFVSKGTKTSIQGVNIIDGKVHYKVILGDAAGNPTSYWVRATNLKTLR